MAAKWMTVGVLAAASGAAATASAQEVYLKGGFLGLGVGYAQSVNERFGWHADLSTIGSPHRNRTSGDLTYAATLKANQAGAYVDWFPFANGFRVTAGLHVRKLAVEGDGTPDDDGTITVNDTTVPYGPGDDLRASVKFPDVAPYLGVGWGLNDTGRKGWGFVFDAGVTFGKPKTRISVSDALYARLDAAARAEGTTADAEIEAQRRQIADDADDFKVWPQVYVGVSYRF
ncbi:hypothetical protein GCM10023144_37810 [Pigmentiphaga soli]|uniref:Outer membrane protein beta-barrel domain-containing protein n=1 Tax=Pigmentiphaga soli TaxID=1007095 RepID=A0ABP8HHK6_9BURK